MCLRATKHALCNNYVVIALKKGGRQKKIINYNRDVTRAGVRNDCEKREETHLDNIDS